MDDQRREISDAARIWRLEDQRRETVDRLEKQGGDVNKLTMEVAQLSWRVGELERKVGELERRAAPQLPSPPPWVPDALVRYGAYLLMGLVMLVVGLTTGRVLPPGPFP